MVTCLHGDLDSIQILQKKILLDEWVDGPCHHVHHYQGFSKVLTQVPTTAVHMVPIQDAFAVLAQLPTWNISHSHMGQLNHQKPMETNDKRDDDQQKDKDNIKLSEKLL